MTCAFGEDVVNRIHQFMCARADGKTRKCNRELYEFLCDPENGINYDISDSALNMHMRRCEKDLYMKMRATDIKMGIARGPSRIDATLVGKIASKKVKRNTNA